MKPYNTLVKNTSLIVKQIRHESANHVSIVFERPVGFTYAPGDWIDIQFDVESRTITKTFSFSSSPTEPDIMITYKTGISLFKARLQSLRPSDKVAIYQYGNSGFGLDERYDLVMIAGGVGIAPFRSMIRYLYDSQQPQTITLLYQSRTNDFPFKDELASFERTQQNLKIIYIDSTLKGRLKHAMIFEYITDSQSPLYYIAGPPGMVDSTERFLIASGIAPADIMDDEFSGY